ncbi:hypothetical protein HMPREF1567_2787 [Providencia alcalifaciens PAL-2]|nr:hypothetical protein HMPREF1562_3044 [Providencia alcalifaciens F90-2004]EUC95915.1 hypothetical protein HMPREF1567_2787 [Providencia alcalifaciens PAL-2]EUD05362.1 hypothetical protein HMPREF1564_0113 [Providencia alcalifaciens R90-1475]
MNEANMDNPRNRAWRRANGRINKSRDQKIHYKHDAIPL